MYAIKINAPGCPAMFVQGVYQLRSASEPHAPFIPEWRIRSMTIIADEAARFDHRADAERVARTLKIRDSHTIVKLPPREGECECDGCHRHVPESETTLCGGPDEGPFRF